MIATACDLAAKLPPSVRDFEIYQYVKFECRSTRAAARDFGLSQTRIRQIVAGVRDYFLAAVPRTTGEDEPDTRLVVAEQLAREQLDYLYCRAVRAFQETEREDVHGNLLPGRASYLLAAARITLWMAKVPVHGLPAFRDDESSEAATATTSPASVPSESTGPCAAEPNRQTEQLVMLARAQATAKAVRELLATRAGTAAPLDRECSPSVVSRSELAPNGTENMDVNSDVNGTCDETSAPDVELEVKSFPPAQPTNAPAQLDPRMGGSPESADLNGLGQRPLNRKERRAREKLRKRFLAKGKAASR